MSNYMNVSHASKSGRMPQSWYKSGFGAHAGFPRLNGAPRVPPWLLVLIVGAAVAFWLLQPIILTNDTIGYLEAGRFFTSFRFRDWSFSENFPYWRMPLFPLLLVLTGAVQGWTVKAVILVHLGFGILMPILVYFSLSWINTRMAALTAAILVASLIPLANIGYVMTNQLFMFLMVVSVFLSCRYIGSRRIVDLYALAITCFLAVMTRPQANYVWLLLLAACFVANPRRWRHCVGAGLLAVALQLGFVTLRPMIAGPISVTQNEILLPDGEQDQDVVFQRAIQLINDNRIDSARAVAGFVENPTRVNEIYFAIVLKTLANSTPWLAEKTALAMVAGDLRDQALFYTAAAFAKLNAQADAQRVANLINSDTYKSKTTDVNALAGVTIPVVPAHSASGPQRYITDHTLTTSTGRMLIYPIMNARSLDPKALIVPENGPETARLYKLLINYFFTEGKNTAPQTWLAVDDPALIARGILNTLRPPEGQWTLWNILDRIIGPVRADQLCKAVFFEFARLHPGLLAKYFLDPLFSVGLVFGSLPMHVDLPADSRMIERYNRDVARSKRFFDTYLHVAEMYRPCFVPIGLLSLLLAGAGLFFVRDRRLFIIWAMLCAVGAHQIGLCAIAGVPYYSYTAPAFIFFIMASGITVYAATMRYRQGAFGAIHRRLPHPVSDLIETRSLSSAGIPERGVLKGT